MSDKAFVWLKDHLGFYGNPKIRRVVVWTLMAASFLLSWLAFNNKLLPGSAISAILVASLLVVFLCVDSLCYIASVLMASLGKRLRLVRKIDTDIDAVICRAEDDSIKLEGNEEKLIGMKERIFSDFENRRPFPRIASILLKRTFWNFLCTVLGFGVITMGLARLHVYYCGVQAVNPYKHSCFEGRGFIGALVHSLYYHLVLFQSLGDGGHAPETLDAQFVAILETLIAFLYMILIIGGVLSVAMFVQAELTPEKLSADLLERLRSVSSGDSEAEEPKTN